MNPDIPESNDAAPETNAVSLFGQSGGATDFPVLKAFQEYIDAEQAKARKRMFGLSLFFIVLLVVVVVTFTIIIASIIGRNQALSDRLLDNALRDKAPAAQPVVNVQSPTPAPVVQPVIHPSAEAAGLALLREELKRLKEERQAEEAKKIDSLAAALAKAQQQPIAPAPVVVTTSPTPVMQPGTESAEVARLRAELRREKEERKAEQERHEKEKKEAEKQAFLRRRYPDYYAKEDARQAATAEEAKRRASAPLPAAAPAAVPASASAVPPPAVQPTTQTVSVPDSAELNRQREELRREEEKLRRERAEQKKQAEKVRQEAARLKAEQAKRDEEKKRAEGGAAEKAEPQPVPSAPPSPSQPPPQATAGGKKPKAITYFNESDPGEDPELNELLKARPASQPVPQPAVKPVAKPTPPKPVMKAVTQPVAKPAPTQPAQPAATPSVQRTALPMKKTETLAIGGAADGNSIPWLIELPVQ